LSIVELQQALAVKADDTDLDHDDIVREDEIVAICSGLITIDQYGRIVRLIHYTTGEYLKGAGADWIADASEVLASTCLRFLSFKPFLSGPYQTLIEIRARLTEYPFLVYAANNWGNHTYDAQESARVGC
jgi:two-component SAPR family response regulator